ncbi:MAG TPA: hypothetical protein PKD96_04230 [Candidatus Absconditabacterales bacterium]|nr:hypothetical protein [Candidatus Absconditabacterales bacterium]HMT27489.1 hypothetical protein [Candidatus Absconditabacterales bacterium]
MRFILELLLNIYFYIGVIIFGFIIFYFDLGDVSSSFQAVLLGQENIKIGTHYVQKKSIDNTVYAQTLTNIALGERSLGGIQGAYSDVLVTIQTMEVLISTDIIALLEGATERRKVLSSYNGQVDTALARSQDMLLSLQTDVTEYTNEMTVCDNAKKVGDTNFFQGLSQYDIKAAQDGINQSIENGQCATKYRILLNSQRILLSKLVFLRALLVQKNDLIVTNEDNIIIHLDFFKDELLEKLINLRDQLKNYNAETI